MQLTQQHYAQHVQQAKLQSPFILSDYTFPVDRMVFSNFYGDVLKDDWLKAYLLICRVSGFNNTFFLSQSKIAAELNTTVHHVKKILIGLEQYYFIQRIGKKGRANEYEVLTVPDYCRGIPFSNADIPRHRADMKGLNRGYVEFPGSRFEGSILRDQTLWTTRKIRLLGKLYLYCWLKEYGGVEPRIAHVDHQGKLRVNQQEWHDIGLKADQAADAIARLIRDGEILLVDAVYRRNPNSDLHEDQFVGDDGRVHQKKGDKIVTVLRPKHLSNYKLNNVTDRIPLGAIIH